METPIAINTFIEYVHRLGFKRYLPDIYSTERTQKAVEMADFEVLLLEISYKNFSKDNSR